MAAEGESESPPGGGRRRKGRIEPFGDVRIPGQDIRQNRMQQAEFGHARQGSGGAGFVENQVEFVAQAFGGQAFDQRQGGRDEGQRIGREAEGVAGFVADGAIEAGGVVVEGLPVQDADEAVGEVGLGIVQVEQGLVCQAQGQGVDAEVAPGQVVGQYGGTDVGQAGGRAVGFAAGGDQVEGQAFGRLPGGGAEFGV